MPCELLLPGWVYREYVVRGSVVESVHIKGRGGLRQSRAVAAGVVLALLGFGGCASYPSHIAVGMARQDVITRFGPPSVKFGDAHGETLIYSTAPMGQFAYAAQLDPAGRVTHVEQVLTLQKFAEIRVNAWDQKDVLDHFGVAAQQRNIRGHRVWDYRYKESGVYNSLFTITFNDAGVVMKAENGPDPMFDGGDNHGHM